VWDPRVWGQRGSFANPVPIPAGNPATGPWLYARIEPSWLPYLLGAAEQLLQPSTWDTTDPDARLDAQMRAMEAIFMLAEAAPMIPVQFQFTETCGLQVSADGGTTWSDVPGWSDYAHSCFAGPAGETGPVGGTGPAGETGPAGPPGNGYATSLPINPSGAEPQQAACNVANYIALSIIKAALSQAIASIGDSQTLLQYGAAITALIPGVDLVIPVVMGGASLLYGAIESGTLSDFTDAEGDGTLWSEVQCAVFSAIAADAGVTAENFPTLLANIGAISYGHADVVTALHSYVAGIGASGLESLQQLGGLAVGDCSACPGWYAWCYHFDFRIGDGGFVTNGGLAVYVPTAGWAAVNASGTVEWLSIIKSFASTHITSIRVVGYWQNASTTANGGETFNQDGSVAYCVRPPSAGAFDLTSTVDADLTGIIPDYSSEPFITAGESYLTDLYVRGTGTCPFGTPNCT